MKAEPEPVSKFSTVHEQLIDGLRLSILNGEYLPGHRLRQVAVAGRFGVSAVPVREALRALEQEGLVESNPRRGWMVTLLTEDEIREIYELRSLLEQKALRDAVRRLTESEIEELSRLKDAILGAPDPAQHLQRREDFYAKLYGASGKTRTVSIILNLHHQLTPYLRSRRVIRSDDAHRELLDAVRAKDADRACEIVAAHLAEVEEHCVEAVRSLTQAAEPEA